MINHAIIDFTASPRDAIETGFLIPHYRGESIFDELWNLCDPRHPISMLHLDVLILLYHFARYAEGSVLELGPFVGGSTAALVWGLRDNKNPGRLVSVEMGGKYEHPTLSTDDILRDLRANLARLGLTNKVDLVVGNTRNPSVVRQVEESDRGAGFSLMFIDTDGLLAEDFALYRKMLRPGAYVVVDDYFAPGAPWKVAPTREGLRVLVEEGVLQCLGVYGWGTWVGRLR